MSDRNPVPGETHLDRLDALIEAYEPGNYALADGVCHVYYEVPGSTTALYADLVKLRRASALSGGLADAARAVVEARAADAAYINAHLSVRLGSAVTQMASCLERGNNGWRPIDSLKGQHGGSVLVGAYYASGKWDAEVAHFTSPFGWYFPKVGQDGKPTHWHPMPAENPAP